MKSVTKTMAHHLNSARNAIIGAVVLLIISAFPLAALLIGFMRINECSIQRMIPIWLIVVGVIGVAGFGYLIILLICQLWCYHKYDRSSHDASLMSCFYCITCIISTFYFAWMIVGCFWIFAAKATVKFDDPTSGDYCHQSVYNYAFGLVILQLCLAGLFESLIIFAIIVALCKKVSDL